MKGIWWYFTMRQTTDLYSRIMIQHLPSGHKHFLSYPIFRKFGMFFIKGCRLQQYKLLSGNFFCTKKTNIKDINLSPDIMDLEP